VSKKCQEKVDNLQKQFLDDIFLDDIFLDEIFFLEFRDFFCSKVQEKLENFPEKNSWVKKVHEKMNYFPKQFLGEIFF